eukprot:TRINITY_DN4783_c0_g2_i1.p1 TRINITY_DN4783_c0_g2~~TRINITY_DN4783_c0_g2_i1.p1  ORF type:complete len:330 (-),score=103.61 TRINITY_DN4783_c0_g2_i1:365-1354(-)
MVNTTRLLLEVDIDEGIKELFCLKDRSELETILKAMDVENEGYLAWGEFVELLFRHKRTAKPFDTAAREERKEIIKPVLKAKTDNKPEIKHSEKELSGAQVKDYSKAAKKAREEDPKITIPKPFSFNERDKGKKRVVTAPAEEDCQPFTANPIPVSTLLPKYEMIVAKNEARRMEIKQASYAITKAREKPFSFYERDKEKHIQRMNADYTSKIKEKQFKANPIPPHVTVQIYEQMMREREARREERIKRGAEELLAKSKLPPRMETDYLKKKAPRKDKAEFSFKPKAARPLPDFRKQYDEFQRVLEKHKQEKKPTTPTPFHFEETKVVC